MKPVTAFREINSELLGFNRIFCYSVIIKKTSDLHHKNNIRREIVIASSGNHTTSHTNYARKMFSYSTLKKEI